MTDPAVAAMRRMPKYVVSSTLERLDWRNSHLISDNPAAAVTKVADGTDGDLVVFGSGLLVRGLAELDLIDEYRLPLFPVVLGAGKRMFDDHGHRAGFTLTDSVIASTGVVILTYIRNASTWPVTCAEHGPAGQVYPRQGFPIEMYDERMIP